LLWKLPFSRSSPKQVPFQKRPPLTGGRCRHLAFCQHTKKKGSRTPAGVLDGYAPPTLEPPSQHPVLQPPQPTFSAALFCPPHEPGTAAHLRSFPQGTALWKYPGSEGGGNDGCEVGVRGIKAAFIVGLLLGTTKKMYLEVAIRKKSKTIKTAR